MDPGPVNSNVVGQWGQFNGFLVWDFASSVDKSDRWEMTVWLAADSPQAACTVDVTPRRCAEFKPKDGEAAAGKG